MAANTFATMLHRRSPKMGVLLVYTLLEWTLIALLLLNALFSYLITRFANYFGLKPPCLLCSRVDHLFEPGGKGKKRAYTDLLCNDHVAEISRLGFCSRHQKVPDGTGGFCPECCSECGSDSPDVADGDEELKCCCCSAPLDHLLETSDDSVESEEVFDDAQYSQITLTFREGEGESGDQDTRNGAFVIILEEEEEEEENDGDTQNHYEEAGDGTMVVENHEGGDVNDEVGEKEADHESSDVVSVAQSQSSDQFRRVYGADYYVKLLRQCRECGTIMEEMSVSEEMIVQNAAVGSSDLHSSEAKEEKNKLSPKMDDLPGPNLVAEAGDCTTAAVDQKEALDSSFVNQKEALDSSLVFFYTRGSGDATADRSLVRAADIFDYQVLHCQQSFSPGEAHLISVDNAAAEEDTAVAKEIHIASEAFDQNGFEMKFKSVSVSDGISEEKPVQVVHTLDHVIRSTGICIEREDNSQDNDEDGRTDGDASGGTDANEEHLYVIQNQELLRPLLDHSKPAEVYSDNDEKATVSDDNGMAGSDASCEVSIGSEIPEQELPVPLQAHESHFSLADHEGTELKHAIGELDEDIVVSEGCSRIDVREISVMPDDHEHCQCELILSSNASFLESDEIEAEEHKEIFHTEPSSSIQTSQSTDNNPGDLRPKTGDAVASQVGVPEIAKDVTEGDGGMLSGNDIQIMDVESTINVVVHDLPQRPLHSEPAHSLGLQLAQSTDFVSRMMGEEKQGDGAACEESGNITIATSFETSIRNQLYEGQMDDSSKQPETPKEDAEEIPSQESYSQIKIGSTANNVEASWTVDHIENHHQHTPPEDNEMDDDKAPETPYSEEGIQSLPTRLAFDRRDHATESVDGSVASEVDWSEPLTLENLKAALKAERNALRSLYAELEEERSASAIAANQTMAMITRLQEEKASMQMEALQYQRMMEEQSEYDQEALQMLNELVMKREKEKQELEKELEMYRKEADHQESKKSSKANGKNGFDSSTSDDDDSDGHSYDSNEEGQNIFDTNRKPKTSTNVRLQSAVDEEAVSNLISLNESLDDFEEERMSVLMQLKELEEKLYAPDDDSDGLSRKRKHEDNFADEHLDILDEIDETHNGVASGDGFSSGFSDDLVSNEKESRRGNLLVSGKRLLPLFDAAASDTMEGSQQEPLEFSDVSPESVSKSDVKISKVAIAEEVNQVYERLLALEADREFLKHCIRSLKNGDRGIKLLQDILQHLHDLKQAELQPRGSNIESGPSSA